MSYSPFLSHSPISYILLPLFILRFFAAFLATPILSIGPLTLCRHQGLYSHDDLENLDLVNVKYTIVQVAILPYDYICNTSFWADF